MTNQKADNSNDNGKTKYRGLSTPLRSGRDDVLIVVWEKRKGKNNSKSGSRFERMLIIATMKLSRRWGTRCVGWEEEERLAAGGGGVFLLGFYACGGGDPDDGYEGYEGEGGVGVVEGQRDRGHVA